MGGYIAIHAGSRWDAGAREDIERLFAVTLPSPNDYAYHKGHIIAVGQLIACVDSSINLDKTQRLYFNGKYGWLFDSITSIAPVPVNGGRGLWTLDPSTLTAARQNYAAAQRGDQYDWTQHKIIRTQSTLMPIQSRKPKNQPTLI